MTRFAAMQALGLEDNQTFESADVRPYHIVSAPAATLAAGATSTVIVRTSTTSPYIITKIYASAKLGVAIGASAIGTELPAQSDVDDAANTMPTLGNVGITITIGSTQMSNAEQKLANYGQFANNGPYRPTTPIALPANGEIRVTFKNNHATASILPELNFDGYIDARTV